MYSNLTVSYLPNLCITTSTKFNFFTCSTLHTHIKAIRCHERKRDSELKLAPKNAPSCHSGLLYSGSGQT